MPSYALEAGEIEPAPEIKMDPARKARWIGALRSGAFAQGSGNLATYADHETGERTDRMAYCCLGVLCLLEAPRSIDSDRDHGAGWYDKETAEINPWVPDESLEQNYRGEPVSSLLAGKNDRGADFAEIADWVEINL